MGGRGGSEGRKETGGLAVSFLQIFHVLFPSLLTLSSMYIDRYFTPMEVARLMHFPSSFAFPARTFLTLFPFPPSHPDSFIHSILSLTLLPSLLPSLPPFLVDVSDKKCYELLGNSLHVGVATELLVWLLREDERDGGMEGWRAVEG